MTTILTDSMAREHIAAIEAAAATSRRRREALSARRASRNAARDARHGRTLTHPFAAARRWLVAGEL